MSSINTWRGSAPSPRPGTASVLAVTMALSLTLIVALGSWPAAATAKLRHKPAHKDAEHVSKEPFGNIPKGPLQIFISINQQKLHVYSDGVHVADSSIATGVPSLPTPLGAFSVIQKQVFHRSNIYSNAPMPYMQRITWSGVALHEGENIGHRASHGCIRMPHDFAVRLYSLTRLGARVIIADPELKPVEFADPHLFVHKDRPPDQAAAEPAAQQSIKTAQAADGSKTIDAGPAEAASAVQPAELGLRVSNDAVAAASDPPAGDPPKSDASKSGAPAAAEADAPASTASEHKAEPAAPGAIAPVVVTPSVAAPAKKTPIAIFISRKEKKIYVRRDFEPLFEAAITIEHPDEPLGTHVFTAMELQDDHTTFRWTVVSLPGEPPKPTRTSKNEKKSEKHASGRRHDEAGEKAVGDLPPPQTPQQALARIDIPQDAIDYISDLMVPGSSLIVSDQGLGDETGEGTDFIVVTR